MTEMFVDWVLVTVLVVGWVMAELMEQVVPEFVASPP